MKVSSDEIWKDIVGYEGLYKISNTGTVKALSVNKLRGRFYQKRPEKIMVLKLTNNGYLSIQLSLNNNDLHIHIHRLVAEAFIDNPENKPQVNHKDGNKLNNNDWNLEWATAAENTAHALLTGLSNVKGEAQTNSKLTNEKVLEIRNSRLSHKQAAKKYGVYFSTIQKIRYRKSWAHI